MIAKLPTVINRSWLGIGDCWRPLATVGDLLATCWRPLATVSDLLATVGDRWRPVGDPVGDHLRHCEELVTKVSLFNCSFAKKSLLILFLRCCILYLVKN